MSMKPVLLAAVAAIGLAGCGANTTWDSGGPDYRPASPQPSFRPAVKSHYHKVENPRRLAGSTAPKLNAEIISIDEFDLYRIMPVPVKNGELLTITFPPGEQVVRHFFGGISDFVDVDGANGGIGTFSVLPQSLLRAGDVAIMTTNGRSPYRFRLIPGKKPPLKGIVISSIASVGDAALPTAALPAIPREGAYTPLKVVSLDGEMPAWAPINVWTDSKKMVVELKKDFPIPTFLAGNDAVVEYGILEFPDMTAFVTRRPITEAMLVGDGGRILISAQTPEKSFSGWRRAEAMRPAREAGLGLADYHAGDMPAGVTPADVPLDGKGLFAKEIEEIERQIAAGKKAI